MQNPKQCAIRTTGIVASLLLLSGCGPAPDNSDINHKQGPSADQPPTTRQITGSVSYRERIALSPQAILTVQLRDVSLADAPAMTVAELTITDPGQVPIDFALEYDPARIDERHSYSMHAVIHEADQMRFTTDSVYPVLTRGHGDLAIMTLVQVSSVAQAEPASALTDKPWTLHSIKGKQIVADPDGRPASLLFSSQNSRVEGFSGCNQFNGSWSVNDDQITFGPMAMTMMACADTAETEQLFMQALDAQNRFEITGNELLMFIDDQQILLFRAMD